MKTVAGVLAACSRMGQQRTARGPLGSAVTRKSIKLLRQRLFEPGEPFQLGQYLEESYSDLGSNLLDLLGTYKGDDFGSKFKNGSPNSANMLLWHFLMASLARDVSKECGRSNGVGPAEGFQGGRVERL